jgi:drug/metabolite transporter (DMT)-like permease
MIANAVAVFCVFGMVVGQLLFKVSASALADSGTFFSIRGVSALVSALALYGFTSIGWVWALQKVELGRIYPLMALAFVLVPLGSHFAFGESFPPQYFVGIGMIVIGIILTVTV